MALEGYKSPFTDSDRKKREERAKQEQAANQANQKKEEETSFLLDPGPYTQVGHVIGVVSGKGGVGKSLVTSLLANRLSEMGYRVGIMDADITGPSIPRMYGLTRVEQVDETGIFPVITENDIKVISLNLLLDDPNQAVVWRGPVIGGVVKQFWTEVVWGELDYLLVDMPPGTGDVPLTVFQSLPVDGIVVVTSPQELVGMIVNKACNMAELMKIPVLGIVENFSYVTCPDCGRKIEIFGKSHLEEEAAKAGVPALGSLGLDPAMAAASDAGRFAEISGEALDKAVNAIRHLPAKEEE